MAYQVVVQPNGYLALWSTVSSDYIKFNQSKKQVFDFYKNRGLDFYTTFSLFCLAYEDENIKEWDANLRFIKEVRGSKEAESIESEDNLMFPTVDFRIREFCLYRDNHLLTVFKNFSDFKNNYQDLTNKTKDFYTLRDSEQSIFLVIVNNHFYVCKDWIY